MRPRYAFIHGTVATATARSSRENYACEPPRDLDMHAQERLALLPAVRCVLPAGRRKPGLTSKVATSPGHGRLSAEEPTFEPAYWPDVQSDVAASPGTVEYCS